FALPTAPLMRCKAFFWQVVAVKSDTCKQALHLISGAVGNAKGRCIGKSLSPGVMLLVYEALATEEQKE
ncbi:MAG: hypothetical protein AAFQ08_03355, partial [Bacteroidota bacterium]